MPSIKRENGGIGCRSHRRTASKPVQMPGLTRPSSLFPILGQGAWFCEGTDRISRSPSENRALASARQLSLPTVPIRVRTLAQAAQLLAIKPFYPASREIVGQIGLSSLPGLTRVSQSAVPRMQLHEEPSAN